jgi:hypothetical protein
MKWTPAAFLLSGSAAAKAERELSGTTTAKTKKVRASQEVFTLLSLLLLLYFLFFSLSLFCLPPFKIS